MINSKTRKTVNLIWFYDLFEFIFRILKVIVLWKLKFMEYHVMSVTFICWKFQNDLNFNYEDMDPFIRAHL